MGTAPPTLHSEYLQAVVVADGNPVGLSRCPLHIVDRSEMETWRILTLKRGAVLFPVNKTSKEPFELAGKLEEGV